MSPSLKNSLLVVLLAAAIVLTGAGLVDKGLDRCGLAYLDSANRDYLDAAFDKALAGFLVLSGIKSGLAVIEGSEVGVGFNLQIGDVVQPLYDYVDTAWRAALAGGSIIAVMQLALHGLDLVDHWALTLLLVLVLVRQLLIWWKPDWQAPRQAMGRIARFLVTLAVACYLLLPLSVTGSAALSRQITAPMIEQTHDQLESIKEELAPETLNQRFFSKDDASGLAALDIKNRLSKAGKEVMALIDHLKRTTEQLAGLTMKLIAAYVFDCVLFPLFFGLIFITMLKSGIGYFFEFRK